MSPACLENILRGVTFQTPPSIERRILAGRARHEDAVVVSVPRGKALVQTVDILAPIVNDPFSFGRIAAANALSDVYALGGEPWTAMNIACFPQNIADSREISILSDILRGGAEAILEAGAVLAGGHTVADDELKYGLSVTGIIDPDCIATNDGLKVGQQLLLTKPLGTGILSTAAKAHWEGTGNVENILTRICGRLNANAASVIRALHLSAATDITGFGLAGHALEMAIASNVCVALDLSSLPLLDSVVDFASQGLIPAGTHMNKQHAACMTFVQSGVDEDLEIVAFDSQTSGGLLLAVEPEQVERAQQLLEDGGDFACRVGEVLQARSDGKALLLRP